MLQVEYALGADLFNSYNWDSVNENNRAILYFKEFLDSVKKGNIELGAQESDSLQWQDLPSSFTAPLTIRPAFPWCNELTLTIKPPASGGEIMIKLKAGVDGDIAAFAAIDAGDIPQSGIATVDFGDMAVFKAGQTPVLNLITSSPGWKIAGESDRIRYQLRCNLKKARRLSQYIIQQTQSLSR